MSAALSTPVGEERRGRVYVAFAMVAFATSGPLAKVTTGMSPVLVAALRTLIAAALLIGIRRSAFARDVKAMSRRDRAVAAIAGVLLGLHFTAFIAGMGKTSLPAGVALLSLEPLAVIAACALFHRLVPTRLETMGIVLSMAGAAVVASAANSGEHRAAGDGLVLLAVALYGVYVACARGVSATLSPMTYIAFVYATAGFSLLPFALLTGSHDGIPTRALVATLAMALIPTLIGHSLVQAAARFARPALVALVPPGETVGAILIGALAMHAVPTPREAAGAAIALAGAVVTLRRPS